MAYLHCHNCEWSQDDFWRETYNPFKSLMDWQTMLLNQELDEPFAGERCMDPDTRREDGTPKTRRDVLVDECERAGTTIRNMKWRTHEEFKADPDQRCPECGSTELDID